MIEAHSRIDDLQGRGFHAVYAQPKDYHFCLESLIFAKFVADQVSTEGALRVLDVCAGCGVIGLEIAHHRPAIREIDFLEKQDAFREVFEINRNAGEFGERDFQFLNRDFRDLSTREFRSRYDLIVANPPYFMRGEGPLSASTMRNLCRFFLDGTLEDLCSGIVNALTDGGRAFLLVKDGKHHGRDAVALIQDAVATTALVNIAAVIRGTLVVKLTKSRA